MLKRLLVTGLRRLLRDREPLPGAIPVAAALTAGCVDHLVLHADRVLSAVGWASDLEALSALLVLRLDGRAVPAAHAFRVARPDVGTRVSDGTGFPGAVIEWVVPSGTFIATLEGDGRVLATMRIPQGDAPAYDALIAGTAVLHREHIYASGPPVHEVLRESLDLARTLPDSILDFGCGGGALVRALRSEGRDIYGLELDRPEIREHLLPQAAPFVTLYDGAGPAPFPDRHFASVTCCEVLEHIPHPAAALSELARLARECLFITVPDMSAIPRGFRHAVIPWHLLEATHVNFFTQHSLHALLAPYAERIDMARVGVVRCGGLTYYTSLAARVVLKRT